MGDSVRASMSLLALASCGRLGFDARASTDAPVCSVAVGHDEDGDLVDDACDVCPHVPAQTQLDGDRDGVGDDCDPEPSVPRQRVVAFDPFVARDPVWTEYIGGMAASRVEEDVLVLFANRGAIAWARPYTAGEDRFVIGASTDNPAAALHLVAIIAAQPATRALLYCELYDSGNATTFKVTYTLDGTSFASPDADTASARFAGGSGTMTLELHSANVACTSTWRGEDLAANAARPAEIAATDIRIYAESVDVRVQYFLHIRTE